MIRVSLAALAAAGLAVLCSTAARAQFPALYTWPGPAPCHGTLQACVDAVDPEDGIDIATDGPIDEDVEFAKSLDLLAAPGFTPVFAAGRSIRGRAALDGTDQFIRVAGLTLLGGEIELRNDNNAGSLIAHVLDNTIVTSESNPPITVGASGSGPLVFRIARNVVSPKATVSRAIDVYVYDGDASGEIADNAVTMVPDLGATAIDGYVQDGNLLVDVVRNRVSGSVYEDGIRLVQYLGGTLEARVLGNLVRNAGAGAGVRVRGYAGPQQVTIVNNTIDANAYGLYFDGIGTYGGGVVANNAITNSAVTGIHDASPLGVAALSFRHNLFHGNAADLDPALSAGPGSVFADPLYTGPADFHPGPGSPAIAAGDPAAVPSLLTTDLDGVPRQSGATVDIGAYQVPEAKSLASGLAALLALTASRWRPSRVAAGGQPAAARARAPAAGPGTRS